MSTPTPPNGDRLAVATDALRQDAGIWRTVSTDLAKIGPLTDQLGLDGWVDGGIYVGLAGVLTPLVQLVADRAGQGVTAMSSIADTLDQVAGTYDREEAEGLHRLKNLY